MARAAVVLPKAKSHLLPEPAAPTVTASGSTDPKTTRPAARFCTGDIMRHVMTMAGTGAIGLMAVFAVDLLNFFYISRLHDPNLTAAIAFTASVSYVQIAVSIGMTIGLGAVIGRMLGARRFEDARRTASAFLVVMLGVAFLLGITTAVFAPLLLRLLGAQGMALDHAVMFLRTVSPALPLISFGMGLSALLRAVGDAKQAMRVTLTGAIISATLDPLLILVLHFGLEGAAISTILARAATTVSGLICLRRHDLLERPRLHAIPDATRQIGGVALPAIATNLATPVAGAYVTRAIARFGLDAVSGQAALDRIVPVAFALVFALTGSVGPIMSQNLGAGQVDRVREALIAALKITAACVGVTWAVLAAGEPLVVWLFNLHGAGIQIAHLFCRWTVSGYLFIGLLFVANTAFNNLGHPLYSTMFNWGRATLGTIPFVAVGLHFGPSGILIGFALGATLFGSAAIVTAFHVIRTLPLRMMQQRPAAGSDLPTRTDAEAMMELQEEGA